MFLTLWATGSSTYLDQRSGIQKEDIGRVSNNYRFYAAKMAELRVYRDANRPLQNQLHELFAFVRTCEANWK